MSPRARLTVAEHIIPNPTVAPIITELAPPPISGIPNWGPYLCYTYFNAHGQTGPSPLTQVHGHLTPRHGWSRSALAPPLPVGAIGTKWYELTSHYVPLIFATPLFDLFFDTPGGASVFFGSPSHDTEVEALLGYTATFEGDAGFTPFTYGVYYEGDPTTTWAAFADLSSLEQSFYLPPYAANDYAILFEGLVTLLAGREVGITVLLDGSPLVSGGGLMLPDPGFSISGVLGVTTHLAPGLHTFRVEVTTDQRDSDYDGIPAHYVDRYAYWLQTVRIQGVTRREGLVVTSPDNTALIADLGDGTLPPAPGSLSTASYTDKVRLTVPPGEKWRLTVEP